MKKSLYVYYTTNKYRIFKQYKSYLTCFCLVNDGKSEKTVMLFISLPSFHYPVLNLILEAVWELLE